MKLFFKYEIQIKFFHLKTENYFSKNRNFSLIFIFSKFQDFKKIDVNIFKVYFKLLKY